ncbi:hypothetical protein [Streptomyces sp. DH12]|uniref:hypothetical protein n=1 Tax=Streptomyces sp. DH12 TaxID=2857010 RepID=UPI001E396146|nr:hypothetical protein [Streptomyces sp. DH12]
MRLSGALGRRTGGRQSWRWVPPVASAVALPPAAAGAAVTGARGPAGYFGIWALAAVAITAAALLSRLRRRGSVGTVALWGTLLVVCAHALCGMAIRTGLLTEYHPPRVDKASLVGTWSDGGGGTLTLVLYRYVGDPDAGDLYELVRLPGGPGPSAP